MTGLPFTVAEVVMLPPELATESVLPVEDGRGAYMGISMMRTLFLMVAVMEGFG